MQLGMIGLGRMGANIVRRLIGLILGVALIVYLLGGFHGRA
jgi:6-phosphogluconate dehydrogenase (decarboxylating)